MYSNGMEKKNKKRPFITAKEAVIAIAVIYLTAIAFEKPIPFIDTSPPPPPARSVSYQEAVNFSSRLQDITSKQIADSLNSGKPTLIVMYTSWCGYCKRLLPNITGLKKEGKIEDINLLLISVDKERDKASKYILEHSYDKIFTPYIMASKDEDDLKNIIKSKNGNYTRAIPYTLFFDSNGNLLEENVGIINKKMLLSKIEKMINKSKIQ